MTLPASRTGLGLVHKPVGATSFGLVKPLHDEAKARWPGKRVPLCHGGTLDPFAEGLLLLLLGPATRLMELHHGLPKTYRAQLAWGVETDNGDPTGRPVSEGDPSSLTPARLEAALGAFLGWTEQVPPSTSAKKLGGEPAYRKVHRGEEVVLPPSRVFLHSARFLEHALPRTSVLEVVCRGGYYVRALARDLGRALGCGAHLAALERTAIGPYRDPGPGVETWLHGADLLPWCRSRTLDDRELGALRKGERIPHGTLSAPGWSVPRGFPEPEAPIRAFHLGKLVALLREEAEGLSVEALLPPGL